MTPTEKYYRITIELIREYTALFVLSLVISFYLDYTDFFGKNSLEIYFVTLSLIVIFGILVTAQKYRYPLRYSPKHVFFVKDRNDNIIKMEPYLDPWIIQLGLINPKEIINIRYSMYPDLDLGLDLDPNTGVITGYPMEIGNHVSEVKMKFLGGSYSTMVRVEAVDTLKEKMIHQRDEFAPPRTVAQLLIREEDLLKREQDLDFDMAKRQELLEEEYRSKEKSLAELISIEKEKFRNELATIKKDYENKLKQKDSEYSSLKTDMQAKLKSLENDRDQKVNEIKAQMEDKIKNLKESKDLEIDKIEAEMTEALQDKEREFVEFEREGKQRFEEKEKELQERFKDVENPKDEVEVVGDESLKELKEDSKGEPVEELDDKEYDYVSMTKAELVELAKKRGLSVTGSKKTLIARLEKHN